MPEERRRDLTCYFDSWNRTRDGDLRIELFEALVEREEAMHQRVLELENRVMELETKTTPREPWEDDPWGAL